MLMSSIAIMVGSKNVAVYVELRFDYNTPKLKIKKMKRRKAKMFYEDMKNQRWYMSLITKKESLYITFRSL